MVMSVVGELQVRVQYDKQTEALKLMVVSGREPSLLGHDWLQKLCLDWQNTYHQISPPSTELSPCIQNILIYIKMSSHKATLQVHPEAIPKFCKAHPVPFSIKDVVGAELNRLECEGILKSWTTILGLLQLLQYLRN